MPLYDYACGTCGWKDEMQVPVFDRDGQACPICTAHLHRQLAAPLGRIAGQVVQGGGPDRFTADMIGCRLDELPAGLRTEPQPK